MLMFAAGMHVPVRSVASSAGAGVVATLLCTALALLAGFLIHTLLGGPALVFALLDGELLRGGHLAAGAGVLA